jgi:predicted peptidase
MTLELLPLLALLGGEPTLPTTGIVFDALADDRVTLRHAVYLPRDYDPVRSWPLVLFLHGSGESGTDGARQLSEGLGPAILADPQRWPAIVLFPQKPTQTAEWEQYEGALLALLDAARRRYAIDPSRIYLTGLSQGGHGSWVLGARHAGLWAAVVPICGYAGARRGDPGLPAPFAGTAMELSGALVATPIWAFHGESDDTVPVGETRTLVKALQAGGGKPRVTVFPGVGHNSWEPAYRDEVLPRWLFAQRRSDTAPAGKP